MSPPDRKASREGAAAISGRLRERRAALEQAARTRIYAISDPAEVADPTYKEGLRAAIAAGLEYGVGAMTSGGSAREPDVPVLLLAQARSAARNRVGLDTVVRRYFAGYSLLGDLLVEQAEDVDLGGAELKPLLRSLTAAFDRLLAEVSAEYEREARRRPVNAEQRHLQLVRRLLDGGPAEATRLAYDLRAHHLAAIAAGPEGEQALRHLATGLDRSLLLTYPGDDVIWGWLGGSRPLDPAEALAMLRMAGPEQGLFAVGEPGKGLAGWRLSHRQAAAALSIARRGPERRVRYADVALLASVLQDDLLATSLRRLYLEPLTEERDGGAGLRTTLRAYFAAECNISSAAAALGVNRNTVTSRLRAIEARLGRSLGVCGAELEVALRFEEDEDDQPASQRTERSAESSGAT